MCMQCTTQALLVQAEVLPGVSLYQATQTDGDWHQGWFGLVLVNDPFMIIPPDAVAIDPLFGLSDDEMAAATGTELAESAFCAAAEVMKAVQLAPENAWTLCSACRKAGYEPEVHGGLSGWLSHRLALCLKGAI